MSVDVNAVTEEIVLDFVRAGIQFTALDVSNTVKEQGHKIRHRTIAPLVRGIFESGALAPFDYERILIDVTLPDGRLSEAYLYLQKGTDPSAYDQREQIAIPVIPDDDGDDGAPSMASTVTHTVGATTTASSTTSSVTANYIPPIAIAKTVYPINVRIVQPWADGRLSIPKALIEQLSFSPTKLQAVTQRGKILLRQVDSTFTSKKACYLKSDGRILIPRRVLIEAGLDRTPCRATVFNDQIEIDQR